jgi:hypothetical protein
MIIHNIEQRSEAWYEARCGRVTGTRFVNLVAKESTDRWKDLITNIACEIITGKVEEIGYVSQAMEDGIEMEPEARAVYVALTGIELTTPGFVIPDEEHKYHEWVGCSPDGLALGLEKGLEIKCPTMKTHYEYIIGNRLPPEYKNQVQGSLFVTGLKSWDFMSYVPGMKPFIITVEPDLELFKEYEARLEVMIPLVLDAVKRYKEYDYE